MIINYLSIIRATANDQEHVIEDWNKSFIANKKKEEKDSK